MCVWWGAYSEAEEVAEVEHGEHTWWGKKVKGSGHLPECMFAWDGRMGEKGRGREMGASASSCMHPHLPQHTVR